jgi:arylsulfatase
MPTARQLPRLFLVVVMPFVAVALAGAVVNGLREAAANGWSDLGFASLTADRVRTLVHAELGWTLAGGVACFVALLILLRLGRLPACLATLPYAGLCVLLGVRFLFPREWSTATVRDDLALPSFFSNYGLLGDTKLAVAVLLGLGLAVALFLWRKGGRAAALWTSPVLGAVATLSTAVALLLLLGANAAGWIAGHAAAPRPLNVIYISWDSTRADHLSCYGYERPTSPNLDAFARDAVLYRTGISQHNWTRPSYASIFTGVPSWMLAGGFDRWALTLAELFEAHGYRTVGLVQNPNLDAELHFDQGFDRFTQLHPLSGPALMRRFAAAEVRRLAGSERPFFLFVHFQGPHWPYDRDHPFLGEFVDSPADAVSPETVAELMKRNGRDWNVEGAEAARTARSMLDLYDASIRLTDESFGELVEALRDAGLYEDSLIVFNSDHGDEFLDHGAFGHAHKNVHPELTYVPLIVRYPDAVAGGARGEVVERPAQSLDLLPTVLFATGIETPVPPAGLSLIDGRGLVDLPERVAYSNRGGLVAARDGRHALVIDYETDSLIGLYDSVADPGELAAHPDPEADAAYAELRPIADGWHEEWSRAREAEDGTETMSEELIERLRGLGYVD